MIIQLKWDENRLDDFSQLLQQGVRLQALLGVSIREVLCNQFQVSSQYLDERVSTIFLDGKPVDDVDATAITEGAVLALSAAMPGFVGAAFRKAGYYAAMRKEITHSHASGSEKSAEGLFVLKLYNMVARELGAGFLTQGVWVRTGDLREFLLSRSTEFWSRCLEARIDGHAVPRDGVLSDPGWQASDDFVQLSVRAD